MKKRSKQYIIASNRGFSMVELVIAIAIMAILVGVIAMTVIPYLEKSRESKDLQTLNTISSVLTTAVSDTQASGTGSFIIDTEGNLPTGTDITDAMAKVLGSSKLTLESAGGNGMEITCYYNVEANSVATYVKSGQANQPVNPKQGVISPNGDDVQCCQYNDNAPLMVTN